MRRPLLVLAAVISGCSSGAGGSTGRTGAELPPAQRAVSANVITAEEMSTHTFENAWQAIISLRPTWPQIPAFVGNGRIQFERLQEVKVATIKEIRLLSREQARVRFGPEAQQTILIVSK